jgi:hypothetical protein
MEGKTKDLARSRHNRRLIVFSVLLALAGSLDAWVFIRRHPTGVLAYALAVLPALPMIGIMADFGLYVAALKDEVMRSIIYQSMLWSIGATLGFTTVWGFLEAFVHIPHLQPLLVMPVFGLFVGVSLFLVARRYE